jgi:hypothetical protein
LIVFTVYEDGVISVSIVADDAIKAERNLWHLAIRWLAPQAYRDEFGNAVQTSNVMGGETDAFLLPHTFGAAIGRKLVEQNVSGLPGFHAEGFAKWSHGLSTQKN